MTYSAAGDHRRSDQGKSFQAFYDFLLSQARQEELSGLLDSVYQLTEITGTSAGVGAAAVW